MKTVGVIVEYNPFHNGHLFHLQEARKKACADVVVAVMSGYFLQRGEPALLSKLARTKMALAGGADIVLELPYAYSTQKAEVFAYGAISLLDALFVDEVCFGSEDGNITSFYDLHQFLQENSDSWNRSIQQFMKTGHSYPKATSLAFKELQPSKSQLDLSQPNNILGYHYIDAIQKQNTTMSASTITRKNAQYHDETFSTTTIASATSIRIALAEKGDITAIKDVVPPTTFKLLQEYETKYTIFSYWEKYFPLLKYRILTSTESELQTIYEIEEGLEHRMYNKIKEADSFIHLMENVKTKRFTWNRLQRACLHILTNTKKNMMYHALEQEKPTYIRLLGMTDEGQQYLSNIKRKIELPLVSRLSSFHDPMIALDKKAASCYSLVYPAKLQKEIMQEEYQAFPYIMKKM